MRRKVLLLHAALHIVLIKLSSAQQEPKPPFSSSNTAASPDPALVPIIEEVILKSAAENDSSSACRLFQLLGALMQQEAEEAADALPQIEATMELLQARLRQRKMEPCSTPSQMLDAPDPKPRKEKEELEEDSAAVMDLDLAVSDNEKMSSSAHVESLCDNCEMNFDDPETKDFAAGFSKRVESSDEVMDRAKGKITRLFVLCGLGALAVIVSVTLALFFGVRACARKIREKRAARTSSGQEAAVTNGNILNRFSTERYGVTSF